ncbi:MAG: rod shape-determining protein MreC [Treponema sp.]|jgi:rod shape-determining protein MreC|nr:rod shape-determining protein MreC [Treponema sp.]
MKRGVFGKFSQRDGGRSPGIRPQPEVYVFASLVLISVFLLLLSTRSFILDFKNAGLSVFSGVRGGIYELSSFVSRTVLSVKELANLKKEYAELLKRLDRYEELERSNAEIILENTRLREQLDFAKTLYYRYIPAQISGRDPNNLFSAIVINKGSLSGVKYNMAVVAWQNGTQALVGKVINVGMLESLVMPIFDVNSLISSRFSVSRFEGIMEGRGDRETPLLMRFIPKRAREEINIGDMIISSGMGGVFPPGINIGRVSAVGLLDYETTLEVEVKPVIDFSRLEYVFLIEPAVEIGQDDD